MDGARTETSLLEAGWSALSEGDWAGARAAFEEALSTQETPDALEGLGWAGYYLDDGALTIGARERAYRLYRERGDGRSAARVAAWLASACLEFRGEPAVANGWLQRAHTLLDGLEPGPDHGWLAVHEADIALALHEDTATVRRLAAGAVELGRTFGVPELEMVGLGLEGRALVSEGDLDKGMRRLDEATVTALAGEAKLLFCVGWACCYLIAACERVRDYDRAGQWCGRVSEFCERHGIGNLLGVCRTHHAGVLIWQGRWEEAEQELHLAVESFAASRPPMVADALVRLADLRRRQGQMGEAQELFARSEGHSLALLGRAALALSDGRPDEAAELADRYLRRFSDQRRTERSAGLEVAARAFAALGSHDRAYEALNELREIATRAGTRPLQAAALTTQGAVAAAGGDHDAARRSFEDALDLLPASQAPVESARVRLELALTLKGLGRRQAARQEAEAALTAFREIGAEGEATRAEAMLAGLRARPPATSSFAEGPLRKLSRRELEVLALVAEGLTNQEIAERLVLSEHTVHRHVTNLLRKLGLPSRAAAASLAGRHGLV
ncbi:MAG TPA: response regulator transcription factor [Gaiellaceae bacterium]|nr:response regulator transcription factor [Gaiellaceae bacterium]